MDWKKIINRELEVAFSRKSQSITFRVIKYIVIIFFLFIFRDKPLLWPIFIALLVLAIAVHLYYRYKTKAWTKSWGGWKTDNKD